MAVCSYFLRGACKFGNACRNQHLQGGGGFGNTSWTNPRFAAGKNASFTSETMKNDLTPLIDKPSWPLSSYGAAKNEPTLLAGLDESSEELRVRALLAQKSGNATEYVAYEASKIAAAEQVYANALNNITEAYAKAVGINGNNQPDSNRTFDSTPALGNLSAFKGSSTTSAFGSSANPLSGATALPQPASAFGQGMQTQQPASIFGQGQVQQASSAFGLPQSTSVFGQPSQPSSLIKPASGAFGNISSTGTNSAFGTSGFSSFAGSSSAFGSNAAGIPPTANVFGQTAFGTGAPGPTQNTPAFGSPPAASAFGAPSAFTSGPGASPGQNSAFTPPPATSTFGAPSAFATGSPASTQPTSAFGSTVPAASVFGAPSAFGSLPPKPAGSAFASLPPKPETSAFTSTGLQPFGTSQGNTLNNSLSTSNPATPFPPVSANLGITSPFILTEPQQSTSLNPPLSAFPMASPSTSVSGGVAGGPPDFINAPSQYKPGLSPYDLNLPPNYQECLPSDVLEAFKNQKFEWGKVPDWIPPLELR